MFMKYAVFTILITIIFTVYLHEYHVSTFSDIKLKVVNLKDTLMNKFGTLMENRASESKENSNEVHNGGKSQIEKLYTTNDLKKCNGESGSKKLYLAILGKVYDVGKGKDHYGPGGGYHFFTGRDASRAFVTGDFSESGLTDDVIGLKPGELKSLIQWDQFYQKEYKYKGKLIGRFYDVDGKKTEYNTQVELLVEEAKIKEETENQDKILFPPCNAEWSQESGSRVWCTTMSGGIERDWVGVPRQLYVPGSESHRCACVNTEDLNNAAFNKAQLKEYPNCNPKSSSCKVNR